MTKTTKCECGKDTHTLEEKIDLLVRDATKSVPMSKGLLRRHIMEILEASRQEARTSPGRPAFLVDDALKKAARKAAKSFEEENPPNKICCRCGIYQHEREKGECNVYGKNYPVEVRNGERFIDGKTVSEFCETLDLDTRLRAARVGLMALRDEAGITKHAKGKYQYHINEP